MLHDPALESNAVPVIRPVLLSLLLLCGCGHNYARWSPQGAPVDDPFDYYRKQQIQASGGEVAKRNAERVATMYGAERTLIKDVGREVNFGVALSGGGVRSASFSQGVLQGLHEIGQLEKVGYLSTVSGGGYTGGWYVTHANEETTPDELFAPGSIHLAHLANYGRYLSSRHYRSSTTPETLGTLLIHNAILPFHLVSNVLFDLDNSPSYLRHHYRDGLARAFLYDKPMSSSAGGFFSRLSTGRDMPDGIADLETMEAYKPTAHRPFWIINMHLSLRDDNARNRARSGDAFELTPLRAGATSVGYVKTQPSADYCRSAAANSCWWMAPYYAVSISGAAFDTQALDVSTPTHLLSSFFNLNLGQWVNGWADGWCHGDDNFCARTTFWVTAPAPWPISGYLTESHNRTAAAKNFYLSDGGHFDNLGLYALIRRGCRTILISDCSRDSGVDVSRWNELPNEKKALLFQDLRRTETYLLNDFGARIEIDWDNVRLLPEKGLVLCGEITNLPIDGEKTTVRLVIFKSAYNLDTLRGDSSFIDELKSRDPDFPRNSTANQFYSEAEVLAYRELGRQLVMKNEDAVNWARFKNNRRPRPVTPKQK